jgi:hypothetical protein
MLGVPHKQYFAGGDCRFFFHSIVLAADVQQFRDLAWQKRDSTIAAIRNFFHRTPVERF